MQRTKVKTCAPARSPNKQPASLQMRTDAAAGPPTWRLAVEAAYACELSAGGKQSFSFVKGLSLDSGHATLISLFSHCDVSTKGSSLRSSLSTWRRDDRPRGFALFFFVFSKVVCSFSFQILEYFWHDMCSCLDPHFQLDVHYCLRTLCIID